MTAEIAELELEVRRPMAWRRALSAFVVTVLVLAAVVAGFIAGYQEAFAARVIPGVTVGGVSIGGLDRADAVAALRARLPSASAGVLVLRSPRGQQSIPLASLGRTYDYSAMLDSALAVGHGPSLQLNLAQAAQALVHGDALGVRLTYNRASLEAAIASVAGLQDASPTDASVGLGPAGTFVLRAAAPGSSIQQAAVVAAADRVLTTPGAATTVDLAATAVGPTVTTAQAEAALALAQRMTAQPLRLTAATDPTFSATVDPATLRGWVTFGATPTGAYAPTITSDAARAALARLAPKLFRAPLDARYLLGKGKVVGVLPSQDGEQLDVEGSLKAISAALSADPAGGSPVSAQLVMAAIPPTVSTAEAQQTAPLMTMVGSWTTYFYPGVSNYWGKNISIPAAKIDGYVVAPGAWFDFWQVVGVPTLAQGYGLGGEIINGHTEETGAIAGGICSTSTTLFNAALRAGYQIGERANHYYYISRYPVGLDATVALGNGWEQDMTWRNDTAYPVLIHAVNAPGAVTFELYSVNPQRTVKLSAPVVKNYTLATTKYVQVTTLKPGQVNQVEYASNGFDAWVTRTVTDASGAVIHQETFYSHYATVNGLIEVGVASLPSASPSPAASPVAPPAP
jgi:vancomycin resistance protein YoaR